MDAAALLRVRLMAIKRTLEQATRDQKAGHVSQAVADNFNKIVADIAQAYPQVKDALPEPIQRSGTFGMMGSTDLNYLDLEILAEQTIEILGLVESEQ